MSDKLTSLEKSIASMRLGRADGRPKPHKPVMLLAVLDMFDAGLLADNRIHFNEELVERFETYLKAVQMEGDWCQPAPPFFHLRTSRFCKHAALPGRERQYARLRTSGGGSNRVLDNIQYAYLDAEAFSVFSDSTERRKLRQFILDFFFSADRQAALTEVIAAQAQVSAYELSLDGRGPRSDEEVDTAVRSAAFRRVVLRAYDHQCAVCGLRMVLPDIASPIDAAHLVPWSHSKNDSPENGMALCKLHHWALDANLVAPTLELRWQVSRAPDPRRNSERELTRFDGLPILLPAREQYYPCAQAIQWRLDRLIR